MLLIGENIHIISKATRAAIEARDEVYISEYIKKMLDVGVDAIDLNIGPARKTLGVMEWLISVVRKITDIPISFDSTNADEISSGLKYVKNSEQCFINSVNNDDERIEKILPLAQKYNCNLIALTMSGTSGIPKEADSRLELAFELSEKISQYEITNNKMFFDPLILPITVAQEQAIESLNAIRMFKESFDPPVSTIIGLSNISNGALKENRHLINLVFLVLAMGCGLDSAIVDGFDKELFRVCRMIENNLPENATDNLYLELFHMMQNYGELEDISFDKNNSDLTTIYKTAEILLNKNIYSNNYISAR